MHFVVWTRGPYWVVLRMYGSHDVRHVDFRGLTVVNGTPRFWDTYTLDQMVFQWEPSDVLSLVADADYPVLCFLLLYLHG